MSCACLSRLVVFSNGWRRVDTGGTNPIYELTTKYGVKTVENNWDDILLYDQHGLNNGSGFLNRFDASSDRYDGMITTAGKKLLGNRCMILIWQ